MERVVVVGGGLAGLESIRSLRELGYGGAITLVAAEPHLPYDRPPLSKQFLTRMTEDTTLEADWDAFGVELRLGCRATAFRDGLLETETGSLDFDGLVIATGAAPVRVPGASSAHVLRTVEDAIALRAAFVSGARVVIVGAGWIGAEVATAAAAARCRVTVVETLGAPLAVALGVEVGSLTISWYGEADVELRLGDAVEAVADDAVALASGEELRADCVVCAVGVRPETSWLRGSGVELDSRGCIVVDASLATTSPGIVAVGDCTAWESRLYGRHVHVEHWDNALRAPAIAAATLLGREAVYDPVPYIWSDQLGRSLQYVGHQLGADDLVLRGSPSGPAWSACWLAGGRLVALLAAGRPRDVSHARRVIAAGGEVDRDRLADPDTPLLVAAAL
jgi:NADPH-dependent 2,4-dienoyl-CoA reductase/sulfur reductase-like enzyme